MPKAQQKPVEKRFGRQRLLTTAPCESQALASFAHDPDDFIRQHTDATIKRDKTSTVLLSSLDGVKVVVKRYNSRNLLHPVKRALRVSRAEHCFNNALHLQSLGVPTPAPVAAVEQRAGPLRGQTWFIARFVEGENLLDWMNRRESLDPQHRVVEQVLGFFTTMQTHGFAHGDMKATNLLVAKDGLYVLDLDGMRNYRSALAHQDRLARDARRFLKNWRNRPDLTALFTPPLQPVLDAEPQVSRWLRQRLR